MNIVKINDSQELFNKLEDLWSQKNCVFRGQTDFRWKLVPNVFRVKALNENIRNFPVPEKKIIKEWFCSDDVKQIINGGLGRRILRPEGAIVKRFFDLNIHIMRYNFILANYFEKKSEMLFKRWKELNHSRDAVFWTKEKTFLYLISNTFQYLITRSSLDGKVIIAPNPDESLTGIDEKIPQHYGVPTAALDFSWNPYVALFFALDLVNEPETDLESGLLLAKKMPNDAKYFSIYAYKQCEDIEKPFISIEMPNESWGKNERAKNQEGVFLYVNNPCSFYLDNDRFPSINDYDDCIFQKKQFAKKRCFELTQYRIKKDENMLVAIKKALNGKKITKEFLFPQE